jgi:flagellar hook assembly protein FlgD
VRAVDHQGNIGSALNPTAFALHVPGVGVVTHAGPLALARPWPNPARGATTLGFTLPASGEAHLEVLDVTGRVVWSQRETLAAGAHAWRWDGRDANGAACSTGLYLVRLSTPFGTRHTRFAWVR